MDVRDRAKRALRRAGLDVDRIVFGDGLAESDRATVKAVERFTMTSPARIAAVCDAVRYLVRSRIEGDMVECGVWRGGSMMAVARTLIDEGAPDRRLFLYDTYAGMTEPTAVDRGPREQAASMLMRRFGRDARGNSLWCNASIQDVEANIARTGYPMELCTFVEGRVEETVPNAPPGRIALLRLDTDWYESTRCELENLFPLLVPGSVLILDDYGHWEGARRAVDEFLARHEIPLLLNRIDYTGRVAVVTERALARVPRR